jgi:hypothetical protein
LWVTSDHGDECETEKHDYENELSGREPKLGFSVPLDSKKVDDSVEHDAASTDSSEWNVVPPESQNEIKSADFPRNQNRLWRLFNAVFSCMWELVLTIEKKIPAEHKSESFIDPLASHANE